MQLMRMMLVAAQTVILVNNVADVSVSAPLSISVTDTAQSFEGWGTSLAWFGQYVGGLEGVHLLSCIAVLACHAHGTALAETQFGSLPLNSLSTPFVSDRSAAGQDC